MTDRPLKTHSPCKLCGSSDAASIYIDHIYCFSCRGYQEVLGSDYINDNHNRSIRRNSRETTLINNDDDNYTLQYVSHRGISLDTFKQYGVQVRVSEAGVPLSCVFPYATGGFKIRDLSIKDFRSEGPMKDAGLFGKDRFSAGSSMAVTVTEGEYDCLSAYQMLGSKYPVVSVRSASSASQDCQTDRSWLNAFDKIYLCFDNDKPGQDAVKEVGKLFDINKVHHVYLDRFKDANEYLVNGAGQEFTKVWWSSKPYRPKNITADYSAIEDLLRKESAVASATYPFQTLQDMTYGIRPSEVVLFTAQEKIGKTELMRAIEHHLLKTTDHNIGIIHLEETEKRSVQGLVGYELNVPVHLPDSGVSTDDVLETYKQLTRRDGRLNFYSHFGSDDPNTILDVIRYMVGVCGCKYVFLDHITMIVTGHEGDDERKKLDFISTRLAMMVKELEFTLFLVSHVNDDGKTRGSRNISKIADLIVHLDRDIESEDAETRNTTKLLVKGNRFAALSGPSSRLAFDPKTFKLKEKEAPINDSQTEYNPGF